ncbi:MAG: leucine-rich repeat domain-containing protein, partial [Bacteroidales bacterium]|nr:leucine-rich repeat domain-containing protein [Bacteroidales bacterium]
MDELDELQESPMGEEFYDDSENSEQAHPAPFFDENGIRFSSSGKIILSFPENTTGRVVIPEGAEHISADAFKHCGEITEVVIPSTIKSLHSNVFRKQNTLRRFDVHPDNIFLHTDSKGEILYNHDFTTIIKVSCDCEEVRIPFGVTAIGSYAFLGCTKLESIEIPDTVIILGTGAFGQCSSLKYIKLSPNIKKIQGWLFMDCTALERIEIPEGVRRIGTGAFARCTSLTEINLPESTQMINEQAFIDCKSLVEVFIPRNVKGVGVSAFDGCSALTDITVDEDNAKLSSEDGILYNKYQSQLMRCPENCQEFDIPQLTSSFLQAAFSGCRNLSRIRIPQYVINIPDYCFAECPRLEEVILPEGLLNIGQSAFENCAQLTDIVLPPILQYIGDYAFA